MTDAPILIIVPILSFGMAFVWLFYFVAVPILRVLYRRNQEREQLEREASLEALRAQRVRQGALSS